MKQIKASISFFDIEENKHRVQGDTWSCKDERADYLCSIEYAHIVIPKKQKAED